MAFWRRISCSKLKYLSGSIKTCHSQSLHASTRNYIAACGSIGVSKPFANCGRIPNEFCYNPRFFAAPVQARAKVEDRGSEGPRLNDKIRAREVRLVTEEGHFVLSIHEALERARKLKLDLVEVDKRANPPVCKIMDFHREKYKQQLKEKERAKGQSGPTLRKGTCKEVRITGKTEPKDIQMKAEMVKRLMERGYRVRCMAMGNEDQDLGEILARLSALVEDIAVVESGPIMASGHAYVIVRHAKFGLSKKGGARKLADIGLNKKPDEDHHPSGLETDQEILSEDVADKISGCSAGVSGDSFDEVFDFGASASGVNARSMDHNMKAGTVIASSASNFRILDSARPGQRTGSMASGTIPNARAEPSAEPENRYRRSGANNRFSQAKLESQAVRDTFRTEPQFQHQRMPSLSGGHPSQLGGESKQVETTPSMNLKVPLKEMPKKVGPNSGPPISSGSSYGIFSTPQPNASGD